MKHVRNQAYASLNAGTARAYGCSMRNVKIESYRRSWEGRHESWNELVEVLLEHDSMLAWM